MRRIERDVADDVTVGDAEIERLEPHDAVLEHDVRDDLVERYRLPLDVRALEPHVDVVVAKVRQVERPVRQHAAAGDALFLSPALFGCAFRVRGVARRQADESAQILVVQLSETSDRPSSGAACRTRRR